MEFEIQNITCDAFRDAEAVIQKAKVKIKEPRNSKERQYYVQDILLEVKTLLSCPNYNARSSDCVNCRIIAGRQIEEYKHLARTKMRKTTKYYR